MNRLRCSYIVLFFAVFSLFFAFPSLAQADNAVIDGDMEIEGLPEWRRYGNPDSWTKNTTTVFEGQQSMQIITNGTGGRGGIQKFFISNSPILLYPDTPYIYRFRYHFTGTRITSYLGITDSNSDFQNMVFTTTTASQGWQTYTREFTISSDRGYALNDDGTVFDVRLIITTQNAELYVDNVEIIEKKDITITTPQTLFITQRDEDNTGDILVEGTYVGTAEQIEARFNGGAWTVIEDMPENGVFSAVLEDQPVGQGVLEVRFSNDEEVVDSVEQVGVGDLFVIAGSSNAEGQLLELTEFNHEFLQATVYTEADVWQLANGAIDSDTVFGSFWPLFASRIMTEQHIPIGFITTADQNTGVLTGDWIPGGAAYVQMIEQIQEATQQQQRVAGVLFMGGEQELRDQIDSVAYALSLQDVAIGIQQETGNSIPVFIGQTPGIIFGIADAQTEAGYLTAIRVGEKIAVDNIEGQAPLYLGPELYDIGPLRDNQFITNEQAALVANRWALRVSDQLYAEQDSAGPLLLTATSTSSTLTLTFEEETLPLIIQNSDAFLVRDDQGRVGIISAVIDAENPLIIRIVLERALTHPAFISFGTGIEEVALTDSTPEAFAAQFVAQGEIVLIEPEVVEEPEDNGGGGDNPADGEEPEEDNDNNPEEEPVDDEQQEENNPPQEQPLGAYYYFSPNSQKPASEQYIDPALCPLPIDYSFLEPSTGEIYYVTDRCEKRRYASYEVYRSYQYNYREPFIDTKERLADIPDAKDATLYWGPYTKLKGNRLVTSIADGKIYIVLGNKKHWLPNKQTFDALGFRLDQVLVVSTDFLLSLEQGVTIP